MKDVDLLVKSDFKQLSELIKRNRNPDILTIREGSKKGKYLVKIKNRYIPVDIMFTDEISWPYSLLHFTGSKEFNIKLRAEAVKKNMKLNEYGLFNKKGKLIKLTSENDIIEKLIGKNYPVNKR